MAARKIAGPGRLGSIKAAKKSVKKSGNSLTKNIPDNDSITVRYLEEPSDWFGFYEYWDAENKTFRPVIEGEDLPDGVRASFRYLANAYVVDDAQVRALKMPKTVVEALLARYEKHGTVLDRDYELSRSGSGLDTTYLVTPDSPAKMNTKRFTLIDLEDLLAKMLDASDEADEDDDDDDDEEETPRRSTRTKTRRTAPKRSSVDDDDDEDDDEDEDDEPAPRRPVRRAVKKTAARKPVRKTIRR